MKSFLSIPSLLLVAFVISSAEASVDRYSERWRKERESFPTGLKMKDDTGRLVELTIADGRTFGVNVKFLLYSHSPQLEAVEIVKDNYKYASYNTSLPTVFITHGWVSNRYGPSCYLIRDAYLNHGGFNVIVADWSSITYSTYEEAASQVHDVGMEVAGIIKYLERKEYLKIEDTILVGHSLGAHVMGAAGDALGGDVKTIFGLDPALPLFKFAPVGWRLTKHDAKYVEIIHTNAGVLGTNEILGHADFFVNGGIRQKDCEADVAWPCSHDRAYELFAESVNPKVLFEGAQCDTQLFMFLSNVCNGDVHAIMGGAVPHTETRGIFGLAATATPTFLADDKPTDIHSFHVADNQLNTVDKAKRNNFVLSLMTHE